MQALKAESSGLRQRLAAEQREVGSLKQSLADRNLAKRQTSQVGCLYLFYLPLSLAGVLTHLDCVVKLLTTCYLFWVAASHCMTAVLSID